MHEVRAAVAFSATNSEHEDIEVLTEAQVQRATKALRQIIEGDDTERMSKILRRYQQRPL